jgi:hypothetical protein
MAGCNDGGGLPEALAREIATAYDWKDDDAAIAFFFETKAPFWSIVSRLSGSRPAMFAMSTLNDKSTTRFNAPKFELAILKTAHALGLACRDRLLACASGVFRRPM